MLADTLDAVTSGSMLLMVGGNEDRARLIESALRKAAFGVRTAWVADLEELEDVLRRGGADLLLCAEDANTPLARVLELRTNLAPELPVLALGDAPDLAATGAAMHLGAADRVCTGSDADLQHLAQVYRREYTNLKRERELMQAQARMAAFESRHRERLDDITDAVIHVHDGVLTRANRAFATLLQRPLDTLVGSSLIDLIAADQQPRVKDQLRQLARGKYAGTPLETVLLRAGGRGLPVSVQLTQGTIAGQSFVEWLIHLETAPAPVAAAPAPADAPATPDRLSLFRALAKAPDDARPRAVMLFLVDGFASLESRVGLEDAERLMSQIAGAIVTRLGAPQPLFRFSTDEWVALVSRATAPEFEKLAERLCRELAQQVFTASAHETRISVTVAAYPIGANEPAVQAIDPLIREGRRASAQGGGQSLVLGPTAQAHGEARENARRAAQLKRALEQDRMRLAYQSIASLEGETRPHYDVLVRMVDETGQERHAGEFIPAAMQFGLMRAVDRWVVMQSLKVLAKRDQSHEPAVLLVKLSEDSLRDADGFIAWLRGVLASRPLRHRELCFAVREMAVQNHLRKTQLLAGALDELGSGLAIEHFGVGTHSAQLLEQLPAWFVKFHPSYARDFAEPDIQKKMADLLAIARRRGVKTIVSHVEDANVMARMWQLGVHYIQGYHVQEPEVVLLAADPIRS
ncbi:MAG: response regulator [Hydrocarboniphaga sp.]|uniref:EAL domain-containing response regulator n=1 Tax=Hydrocarboniphaga sp. TaxID=2033016 RepID=UPI00262AFE01|nr:EAL domain-containing protein [Hydrocarboniphaga sp.]MDB5967640.1 response regulator [Hydrocarboniphaga sp.]